MSKAVDFLAQFENLPPVISPVLRVMNQLQIDGYITGYVIGGSSAIMNYTEAFYTDDIDFFCHAKPPLAISLEDVYQRLIDQGYEHREKSGGGRYIEIAGIQVQFVPMETPLEEEGFKTAVLIDIEGISAKVLQLEYAVAIKLQAGRRKDMPHIIAAEETTDIDYNKLNGILKRFGLLEKWEAYRGRFS